MKSLKDYLLENATEHKFVIKFAEEPTANQVDIIEKWLSRYDLKSVQKPKAIQNDDIDFAGLPNKQIYVMSVGLGMPISQYILLQDLKLASNISEKFLIVRSENEPIEQYVSNNEWEKYEDKLASKNGLVPAARLSTDRLYTDAEQPPVDNLYGDQYNKKLLTYLAGIAQDRPSMQLEPKSTLFSWLKLEDISPGEPHQDTSDFNAYIDTPKPVSKGENTLPIDTHYVNSKGTMSNNSIPQVKFYKDPVTGKAKQVVKPVEGK